jgi:uncharacterized protein YaaQ
LSRFSGLRIKKNLLNLLNLLTENLSSRRVIAQVEKNLRSTQYAVARRIMKMVMAIVPRDQTNRVMEALIQAGHTATFTESRGGMLRQAQYMLFIAVETKNLDEVLEIIRTNCHTKVKVESGNNADTQGIMPSRRKISTLHKLGGAVIFVWDLERFETY